MAALLTHARLTAPAARAVRLADLPRAAGPDPHLAGIRKLTLTAMVVGLPDPSPDRLRDRCVDAIRRSGLLVVDEAGDVAVAVVLRANPSLAGPGLFTGSADVVVTREVVVPGNGSPGRCVVPVAAVQEGGAGRLDGMGGVLADAAVKQVDGLVARMAAASADPPGP